MSDKHTWDGREIPPDETDDTEIKWWAVGGLDNKFDDYWIRGWQEMLEFVKNQLDLRLEDDDLAEGEKVAITFQVQSGRLSEYLEVVTAEEP